MWQSSHLMSIKMRSSSPTVYSKGFLRQHFLESLEYLYTAGISDIRLYLQGDNNCVGMCLDVAAILPTTGSYEVLQLRYLLVQTVDVLMRDTDGIYQIPARGLLLHNIVDS